METLKEGFKELKAGMGIGEVGPASSAKHSVGKVDFNWKNIL
jgi:hypothetical protein